MESRRDNRVSNKIDLISIVIVTMFFILVFAFSYMGLDENPLNVFLVFIVMIGTIIGYYTNITAAMIYSIIFIFIYASVHIFLNFSQGIPINREVYFWMLVVPLFAIIFAYNGRLIKNIQNQNTSLKKENAEFVIIDKETGLMSSQTFFNELQVFMKINERYNIEVYLMLVKIKYENQVIKILGESKYNKMVNEISKAISSLLREEDKKYILRDVNMFGIILLSNKNGGKHVKNRIKEMIDKMDFKDDILINKIKLEIQVGLTYYNAKQISSPQEFYKMAEKDLEFDV
ncbi:MAG: hypothetical protein JM58_06490 [Peptococcaceae bacterium BICA1-8]|nr:MAG: hypothetical protein JM58_06490 [Peptococcaceae bacterium BICA1-8]